MKNVILDSCWSQLRERILAHLRACHAAGRPLPTVALDVEAINDAAGCIFARFDDGAVLEERFSIVDVCVEYFEATQPQIELTPQIAASVGDLRACDNITNVRVLSADVNKALVLITPMSDAAEDAGGDWKKPTEPYLMTIPARTGATVQ